MHDHVDKVMSDAIKKVDAMSVAQLMVEMDKVKDREFVHNLAAIFFMMHEEEHIDVS